MNLNKIWMELIKGGDRNISFISFLTQNNTEFVKVVVKNDLGGKDTVMFKCLDSSKNMRAVEWEHIRKVLKEKTYLQTNEN